MFLLRCSYLLSILSVHQLCFRIPRIVSTETGSWVIDYWCSLTWWLWTIRQTRPLWFNRQIVLQFPLCSFDGTSAETSNSDKHGLNQTIVNFMFSPHDFQPLPNKTQLIWTF